MLISPASRIGLVQEYYFSSKLKEIALMRSQGISVLNLGIGSPDLAPSKSTIEVLEKEIQNPNNHAYQSYNGVPALREAFADWYKNYFGVTLNPAQEIMPLLGSKEGIMHIAMTFLEKGDEVLIPNPGYPTYRSASLLAGATLVEYELLPEKGWLPDLKSLAKKDLSKVKLMWVNYPNMPTGVKAVPRFFEELRDFAIKNQILLVNDNPYSFILNDSYCSMLATEGMMEVGLELNSLSKSHNMAGWRIGMLAGKSDYLTEILKFKSNMDSGIFLPIQLAAAKALQNTPDWYKEINIIYEERRQKVLELMDLLGCTYDNNQTGMFVWAKIPTRYKDSYVLSDELLKKNHLFITPGGIFGSQGNSYLRTSLCADISLFQEAIRRIKANE